MGAYTDTYTDSEKIELLPWLIAEIAGRRNLPDGVVFAQLRDARALDFYDRCYGVLHTYSIEDAADSLEEFCEKRGKTIGA